MQYKTRNLIDQMKAVELMEELRPISATAFRLWFMLNMKWNRLKWVNGAIPFSFGEITAKQLHITRQSVYKARDTLIKQKYIAVAKGTNNNALPHVYICYIPQYIEQLRYGQETAFDRLQELLDSNSSVEDINNQMQNGEFMPPNPTKIKIEDAKKRLASSMSMDKALK